MTGEAFSLDVSSVPEQKERAKLFDAAARTEDALGQISEVYRTGVMFRRNEQDIKLDLACTPLDEGRTMWYVIRHFRPSCVVEVGFGRGTSAAFILGALAPWQGRLISVDPFFRSWTENDGFDYLKRFGFSSNHVLLEQRSDIALPNLLAGQIPQESLSFSFIDGSHFFDDALIDFMYSDRMTMLGGIIAMDDAGAPALRTLASYIAHNLPYKLRYATKRLLLCQKLGDRTARKWFHFRPFRCSQRMDFDSHTDRPDANTVPNATFSEVA